MAAATRNFASDVSLTNRRNGTAADAKSVLSMIAADIRVNDECSVRVQGEDEQAAGATLQRFIEKDLPGFDVPLPDIEQGTQLRELPRALRSTRVKALFGVPVSRGIGCGKAVIIEKIALTSECSSKEPVDPDREREQVTLAIAAVRARIQEKLTAQISQTESAILQAHLAMLEDAAFTEKLLDYVIQGCSAEQAIARTNAFFGDLLQRSDNPYTRERALDIQDICLQLLENIPDVEMQTDVHLSENSVVVAENLTPQQLLGLDRKRIKALLLASGGTTSHTVILARSLSIPTLVGMKHLHLSPGQEVLVDANRGLVIEELTAEVRKFYEREAALDERRRAVLAISARKPAATSDGHAIEVAANVASAEEAEAAFQNGADGIGVFRTEMLFLHRDQIPTEEEQFQIYAQTLRAGSGKPVILRTFDVGADKPFPGLNLPKEDNPFLGYRGIRVYPEHHEVLRIQLRAILRASSFGPVQIMVPMVTTLDEVIWFKEQLAEVQTKLGMPAEPRVPVGIMIEVPAVAFMIDRLCQEIDFFSLGTNDLAQYFFAADRGNPQVAKVSNVREPGFLRLLQQIVANARRHKKWIGICGNMAADPRNLPLLLALGLDEISVPPPDVPQLKQRVAGYSLADCKKLLSQVLSCHRATEVESLLDDEPGKAASDLLDRELVIASSAAGSKEEAIRELVDALYVGGRTDDPDRLEEAVWARESVYSTGLGHGFAVPHCKSNAVKTASMAVLRLKNAVEWHALDGNPVQMVIFLAAPESADSNAHLRVFSRLARNLMDEGFRKRLLNAQDQDATMALLNAGGEEQSA